MHLLSQAIIFRLEQENAEITKCNFEDAMSKTLEMVPAGDYMELQVIERKNIKSFYWEGISTSINDIVKILSKDVESVF